MVLFKLGIIAGTNVDVKIGLDYFRKKGFSCFGCPISKNPFEQTKLQALGRKKLTLLVEKAINSLNKDANAIIIYCNSLSGAISLDYLKKRCPIPLITPLDIYLKIAKKHNVFGLIAANNQSTSNIEKLILGQNKNAIVIGYGNLSIVNDVEKGLSPKKIISKYCLKELCTLINKSGSEIIILGCTHFTYFYEELLLSFKNKSKTINLFEPSYEIFKLLKNTYL